jgi:hypothetical protein
MGGSRRDRYVKMDCGGWGVPDEERTVVLGWPDAVEVGGGAEERRARGRRGGCGLDGNGAAA